MTSRCGSPIIARVVLIGLAVGVLDWCSPVSAQSGRTVKDYGTVGDGQADDTEAIQKAVEAGRGRVGFQKGIYRITRPIVVDLDKVGYTSFLGDGTARIVMAGPGPAIKFVGTHAGSAAPRDFKPDVWDRQRMPVVDLLEIVGDHPEADGIEATGTMQLTISRVTVREARHAIHLTTRNRNILISDCHLYHNRGIGVFYDNVDLHQSNITGCHISYNAGGGIVSRGGNVRNVHIGNCDIESNMEPDSPATANILLDSTGGSIAEVAITGCTIQHNHTSPDSANIRILGSGRMNAQSDEPTQEGHVTITGNVLSDVRVNIHLRQARGVTILGNTFWAGFDHNLLVEASRNVVVGPNNLDRNPRYQAEEAREKSRLGVVFRDSADCTVSGLTISGSRGEPAALLLRGCDRFQISDCTILDPAFAGLVLDGVTRSRVSGCTIRDDRPERSPAPSLKVVGGKGNLVVHNWLGQGADIASGTTIAEGNWDVSK